jgi:hypothetical protein
VIQELSARRQVEKATEKKLSLESVTNLNHDLMTRYHDLTLDQATHSFRHSQFAMAAGLGWILLGVVVALAPSHTDVKVTVGVLTGLAAAIAGYISKTFLGSYIVSIDQINRFFQHPLVVSYLLNAERVSQELNENKEQVLGSVVEESIMAARRVLTVLTAPKTTRPRRGRRTAKPEIATPPSDITASSAGNRDA